MLKFIDRPDRNQSIRYNISFHINFTHSQSHNGSLYIYTYKETETKMSICIRIR
jgi:hypothetical protein